MYVAEECDFLLPADTRDATLLQHPSSFIPRSIRIISTSASKTAIRTPAEQSNLIQSHPIQPNPAHHEFQRQKKGERMSSIVLPPAHHPHQVSFWHQLGLLFCTLFPLYYISYNVHPAFGVHREAFVEWSVVGKGVEAGREQGR
jgi:hypothetical protein